MKRPNVSGSMWAGPGELAQFQPGSGPSESRHHRSRPAELHALLGEDIRKVPPGFRVALGVAFSVGTTLLLMWIASRFPDMEIPATYWIFGAACPALIATPVCFLLVRQGEQNWRLTGELREAFMALQRFADFDQMTGLINRATFFQRARAIHGQGMGAWLAIDVDNFKRINDSFGHDVGDCVLQQVAMALLGGIGSADLCGRIGGEEFAIYLVEADMEAAAAVAETLRRNVERLRIEIDFGQVVQPTVSIGVASGKGVASVEDGLKRADQAMYSAKRRGRNRVQIAA